MADNNRKYRRDHAIEGLVPEKTKMEKDRIKKAVHSDTSISVRKHLIIGEIPEKPKLEEANQKGEKNSKKNDD